MSSTLNALVHTLRCEAKDIISVELRPAEGSEFPGFTPGAHIDLHLPNGLVRSYSLSNSSEDRNRYVVGVLRDRASRGGSRSVHDDLRIGKPIRISAPRNHFALEESADYTVLVAGGIGITPLLSMARRLKSCGRRFEVLYFARERGAAAFLDDLHALGMPLHLHFDQEEGGPPDLRSLLAERAPQPGAHFYACGPARLLDAFEQICADLGLAQVHVERFTPVEIAAAEDAVQQYTVELRKSGKLLEVSPGKSLLDTVLAAGVDVEHSCCEGVCGSCETRVLDGIPDHRDSVLSPSEKASNKVMMLCVSGCKSSRLVLDL